MTSSPKDIKTKTTTAAVYFYCYLSSNVSTNKHNFTAKMASYTNKNLFFTMGKLLYVPEPQTQKNPKVFFNAKKA
jgi:hypothetical protein